MLDWHSAIGGETEKNERAWGPFLAFTMFLSAISWGPTDEKRTAATQGMPLTLWMDWTRGNAHYGADFIELHRPCEATMSHGCECVADFKVISSKENSREFADYVASFERGKVPVVYGVTVN